MLRASDVPMETKTNPGIPSFDGFKTAFDRIVSGEFKANFKNEPQQVKSVFHFTPRGPEIALIFICELDSEPRVGKFFDADALPPNLIDHHHKMIAIAVGAFRKDNR